MRLLPSSRFGRGLAIAGLAWVLLTAVGWFYVYAWVHLDLAPELPPSARTDAVLAVRHVLDGDPPKRPTDPALMHAAHGGPVFVTVWHKGIAVFRHQADAATIADAVLEAATAAATDSRLAALTPEERGRARIKIDITRGSGPLLTAISGAFSLGLVPGVDSLELRLGQQRAYLLADDMIRDGYLAGTKPFEFMEFTAGLNVSAAREHLFGELEVSAERLQHDTPEFRRLRTDSFIESPRRGEPAIRVYRGNTEAPPLTAAHLREAALAGGRYLLRQLAPNGKFVYEYDTVDGNGTDPEHGDYNMPRHAGSTFFLAEMYRYTKLPEFRAGAESAMAFMGSQTPTTCAHPSEPPRGVPTDFACVTDIGDDDANLGASALAVVAFAEYETATGDQRYHDVMVKLTDFLLFMQRGDGSFSHLYNLKKGTRNLKDRLLYFDGEGALALARMARLTKDPRYFKPLAHALDWLTGGQYDYFAGSFYFGEDHWTCQAAEMAYPLVQSRQYVNFCEEYGKFLRRAQFHEGEAPGQDDFVGGYGFTPFFPPNNTPVASRTETMVSAYHLAHDAGDDDLAEATKAQVWRALGFLTRVQVREDNAYLMHDPDRAIGALMGSVTRRDVRIDYIQHACSAIIRATEIFPDAGK